MGLGPLERAWCLCSESPQVVPMLPGLEPPLRYQVVTVILVRKPQAPRISSRSVMPSSVIQSPHGFDRGPGFSTWNVGVMVVPVSWGGQGSPR